MSDLVPLYSLDKVRITVQVPIELMLKIDKRAKENGVSLSHYATTLLYAATYHDPWTAEDEQRRNKIVQENLRKREALTARRKAARAKKGGK